MISQEIRKQFLQYFNKKGHKIISSSPVVPHDDPTLLFINAGMNQFKDVFLGKGQRDYTRATTSQKCIRVGGKHNDLENVGHTSRHLTFFEMLGNFSFGDYFKKEAIAFAWEVSLNIFQFSPDFIWPTVFHEDEEAFALWKQYVPEKRIIRMGEKDNFWAMGETGPCGPCSELLYDRGPSYGPARTPLEDIKGERFLEFWNLVFMQYNRDASGQLHLLPKQSVDTGAGLERVLSLKLGVESLFETDILRELIAEVEYRTKMIYDPHNIITAPAFRVIADHIRSLAFAIADGVQPSNVDRGYVLRKILRRAVRYGRSLGMDKPFLAEILPRLTKIMGADYPELIKAEARIVEIIIQEEEAFLRTLKRGGNILQTVIQEAKLHSQTISGESAFKLKDTYGLPLEEILLLAKDADLKVDVFQFEELERTAKERSRSTRKSADQQHMESEYAHLLQKVGPSRFVGYEKVKTETRIKALLKAGHEVSFLNEGEEGIVILDETPFYAEKGGQIGDQGFLKGRDALFDVTDCQSPYKDLILHQGIVKQGMLTVGDPAEALVNEERRKKIANNHTATHLLHWALEKVLGGHVRQAGSVVDSQRLRFDFSHHKPLTQEEISQIEGLVNRKIRENQAVQAYEMGYEEVQKHQEIKQFFGEKYGTTVRVIDIEFSKELCGGTHTTSVGTIGFFKIFKESSIAAGIRRIEAATGEEAESIVHNWEKTIIILQDLLKTQPSQISEKIQALLEENKTLLLSAQKLRKELLSVEVENFLSHVEKKERISFLIHSTSLETNELKMSADMVMDRRQSFALFLISPVQDKCMLIARVSSDLVSRGIHAQEWIQAVAPIVKGKGGGKPDAAQAGGTAPENIPQALKKAREWIEKACQENS